MSISVACPGCGAGLNLADHLAGKTIKCFQCNSAVTVPAPAEDDYEVVDAEPIRAKPTRRHDDEDDNRPRKKPARAVVDDDDEEDDRPRRKARAKTKGVPVWVFAAAGGGLLALVLLGVGGYMLFGGKSSGLPFAGALDSPPAGYSVARDSDGGFRVFLPGVVKKANVTINGQQVDSKTKASWIGMIGNGDSHAWVTSMPLPANFNPGTSPEQLEQLLKMHEGGLDAPWNNIVSKTPRTLDGKPALELRHWYNGNWMDRDKGKPPTPDPNQSQTILVVTHDGKRAYVIKLEQKGRMPDDATLKTVCDSFKFL